MTSMNNWLKEKRCHTSAMGRKKVKVVRHISKVTFSSKTERDLTKLLNFLETKGFTGRVSAPNQIEVLGTTVLSNKEKREFKNPRGHWEAGLKKGSSFLLQQTLQELGVKVVKKGEQD